MKSLYRHQRVVRMGNKAGRIVRDLFRSFVSEPLQMPTRFQEKVADNGIHRVACDYIAGMTDRFALESTASCSTRSNASSRFRLPRTKVAILSETSKGHGSEGASEVR